MLASHNIVSSDQLACIRGHMVLLVREKGEAKSDIYNGHESP